jgi:hypothetical protein
VANATSRPLYPRERPGTHCTGVWVSPKTVLKGAENLTSTGTRSLDRPARGESPYRLSYHNNPVKVKVKLTLNRSQRPRGGVGVQLYSYSLTSALDRGWWSTPRPGRFTPGKHPVPIVLEVGWTPGPVCTGAENLTPTGSRSSDRQVRIESLYTQAVLVLCLNKMKYSVLPRMQLMHFVLFSQ